MAQNNQLAAELTGTVRPPGLVDCRLDDASLQRIERKNGEAGDKNMNRRALGIAGSLLFSAALLLSAANGQNSSGGTAKGDATKGKEVFEQCSVCHNIDSPEKKMGPSLQGLYKKKTMTTGKAVTDQNVLARSTTVATVCRPTATCCRPKTKRT